MQANSPHKREYAKNINSFVISKFINQIGKPLLTKYLKKAIIFLKKKIVLKISIIHILFCNLYKIQEDNNFVFL